MTERILVDADEYLGAIKIDNDWRFFHDILSMWILDYSSYDSAYVPNPGGWRERILKVDENNIKLYCQAMEAKEIPSSIIPNTVSILVGKCR